MAGAAFLEACFGTLAGMNDARLSRSALVSVVYGSPSARESSIALMTSMPASNESMTPSLTITALERMASRRSSTT
jgi:hypothetical protein